jgi:hypothetical protein
MNQVDESETVHNQRDDVEIEVNYRRLRVPRHVTGSAIKAAAHIDPTFDLYQIKGEEEIPIGDEEEIEVHEGAKFVATPGLEPA